MSSVVPGFIGIVVAVCIVVLAAAVLLGVARILTAPDPASRAVVGDLLYWSCVGILVLVGVLNRSAVVADLAMLAAILGILATVALARILTRGRR